MGSGRRRARGAATRGDDGTRAAARGGASQVVGQDFGAAREGDAGGGGGDRSWRKGGDRNWSDGGKVGALTDRTNTLLEFMEWKEKTAWEEEEKKKKLEAEKAERERKEQEADDAKKEREAFREQMKKDQEAFWKQQKAELTGGRKRKTGGDDDDEDSDKENTDYKSQLRAANKKKKSQAALPVRIWEVTLILSHQREHTGSELAVMHALSNGESTCQDVTRILGLRCDQRLVVEKLKTLMTQGLVCDDSNGGLYLSEQGRTALKEGCSSETIERPAMVASDPLTGSLEWSANLFTLRKHSAVEIAAHLERRDEFIQRGPELATLVARGIAEDQERAKHEQLGPLELRNFRVSGRTKEWLGVTVQHFVSGSDGDVKYVGRVGGSEHNGLTTLLERFHLVTEGLGSQWRERFVPVSV